MRILLDTHVLLWSLDQPERLPNDLRDTLCRRENEVYFSAASIWEIAIKTGLKRFDFNCRPDDIAAAARETGLTELPVLASQASQVAQLPPIHGDPFDRLLIAQAMTVRARFVTAGAILSRYGALVQVI
jgi:PIN domain nuclease of toxin-antitoxin system